jgi:hypothetical protein
MISEPYDRNVYTLGRDFPNLPARTLYATAAFALLVDPFDGSCSASRTRDQNQFIRGVVQRNMEP